jgi:hypothetical protein
VAKPSSNKVNPELERFVSELLKQEATSKDMTLEDKLKVLDRVMKLEQLKAKISDGEFGSGFDDPAPSLDTDD